MFSILKRNAVISVLLYQSKSSVIQKSNNLKNTYYGGKGVLIEII